MPQTQSICGTIRGTLVSQHVRLPYRWELLATLPALKMTPTDLSEALSISLHSTQTAAMMPDVVTDGPRTLRRTQLTHKLDS